MTLKVSFIIIKNMQSLKSIVLVSLICLSIVSCQKEDENCGIIPTVSFGNCIDSSLIEPNIMCTTDWDPVCGCDGVTYSNSCNATRSGVVSYLSGECCGE